ncbi:MAG: MotA/TolQ/ExbB proton channel family protein [Candidatus Omnitrophota bacterium]|jgi:biopolymer transport protein ExbB
MTDFFLKGGFFMWPILFCSVVSLAVVLERFSFFYKTRSRNRNLPERVLALMDARKTGEALALCEAEPCFLGRFLSVGVKVSDRSEEEKQKILRRAGSRELEAGEKYLRVLAVIGSTATLLGLLGTVTGMVQTFKTIEGAGGMADVTVLAGGIWEALLTTVFGLCVAIPTVVCSHYLEGIVDARAIQLKNIASDVFKIH